MWIKVEMFTGRIITDKTLNSRMEADTENLKERDNGSKFRWVISFSELARHEDEYKIQHPNSDTFAVS